MDRLTLTSLILFTIADVFAVVSLIRPDWIVTSVGGSTRIGLMQECLTIHNRPQTCIPPPKLTYEWGIVLLCIFIGCIGITTTIVLLAVSNWERSVLTHARWIGFLAMILFCIAAVIFPIGFHIPQIGGEPYQLPNSHQVGSSYILFILALWIIVISELFVGKVCLPHL